MSVRRLSALLAGTPARLLLTSWAVALATYAAGPFVYHVVPSVSTWLFVATCMAAFMLGSTFGGTLRLRPAGAAGDDDDTAADLVAAVSGIVGLLGIAAITADKLLLSGLDYSQGITALRNQRADEVMAETHLALPRSPLLYVGFVTFAFGIVAYLIYFLRPTALRTRTKILAHLGLLSPAVFSWLYGGRSPLWLLLVLLMGAALARILSGRPILPEGGGGRAVLGALVLANIAYTMYIFQDRREYINQHYYDEMRMLFEDAYPGHPAPWVERLVAKGFVDAQHAMNLVTFSYYFSHEMPVLEMTIRDGRAGPYYGQHQFYLLTAFLARVAPSLSLDSRMTRDLRGVGVYGWFSSAWGGMYLDFGILGAPVFGFLCGWLSGGTYRSALRTQRLSSQLFLCYVVGGILVSPIFSMFTVSISLPILASIAIAAYLLRAAPRWRRARFGTGADARI